VIGFFGKKAPVSKPVVFYNTLGREKQPFSGIRGRFVTMYTCGPTVYDYVTIGNLRSFIFADIARRTLEYAGHDVKQIMNITDVGHLVGDGDEGEDKMTAGLKREGLELTVENMKALATRYRDAFVEDLKELNIQLPFAFPRASEHVPEQIAFIESLFDKGYAYKTSDGVYFDTGKFPKYGALGGISAGEEEHSRVGINHEKRHPQDFALWKFNAGLGWDTAWGKGFPGWHIECTAMAVKYLGKSFDIHTGGIDLAPIHHNNEIAQAEAATGKQYVRYWLHGAFIGVEGKRIGKSEGNAIRLYQLKEHGVSPLAYRYLILMTHYRQPANFTWNAVEGAQTTLYRALRIFADLPEGGNILPEYRERFENAMYDDLNTPEAVAVMWELLRDESVLPEDKRTTLASFDRVLGLGFGTSPRGGMEKLAVIAENELPQETADLVRKREEARKAGDWAEADRLRGEIQAHGYSVEDKKDGPEVRKQPSRS
jgi:cysteinyl-tRNA synthetase